MKINCLPRTDYRPTPLSSRPKHLGTPYRPYLPFNNKVIACQYCHKRNVVTVSEIVR